MFTTNASIISYSRVSSAKQLDGTGIAQQKDQSILNQLSEQYSLPIDERTFSDEGLSGYHGHNLQGEFGRILELIASGSIAKGSILSITSLDRLSRAKTNEAMELMLSVINRGINIYTAMDDKLYSSESSNLTADLIVSVIIMAQAHEESLKKSHRTRGNAVNLIDGFVS
ncbi:recombinase family protein [Vibrio crassostreae]|uniref:recombinase family protein n=1 Tax=Vibrio crassostreae TaxID=246167 RepID=UPI001B3183FA|nr:recombinase family protein [Vibrio crassostreae]